MRVVRSRQAEEDLIDIWTYIARDNPDAADRVLDRLEAGTRLVGRYPEFGRMRRDVALEVRSVSVGGYLILYRVLAEQVEVVRYVYGRRKLSGLV